MPSVRAGVLRHTHEYMYIYIYLYIQYIYIYLYIYIYIIYFFLAYDLVKLLRVRQHGACFVQAVMMHRLDFHGQ
jgi:hypothetical protein